MKIDKEVVGNVLSKTLIFIGTILFVGLFRGVFGNENTCIGISTLVLGLSLLSRDLTNKALKNFGFLIIFNVITVIGAYMFESYLWIGLFLNFLIMAGIGYLFTYEVKRPLNMLFGLQYILIIGTPIAIEQMPKRIIAGIVSAVIIMGLQLIANRNKIAKSSEKIMGSIEKNILLKINLIKQNKSTENVNTVINDLMNNFKILIFESGQTDFKMSASGNISLDILSCIEKINILLDNMKENQLKEEILNDVYIQLENVKNGRFESEDIDSVLAKYDSELVTVHEFLNAFEILQDRIEKVKEMKNGNVDELGNKLCISQGFKLRNWHKNNIKNMSYRVAYGLRLGVLFALTGFITKLFDLEFGKWMMFTVFALTQPYAEFSTSKSKKRVFGTVIGAIILCIVFTVIKNPSGITMTVLIAGYFLGYMKDYKYSAILITICATCSVAVNHTNPYYVIISRVIFIILGVVISIIANKYLFSRKYKDAEDSLISIQKQSSSKMVEEVIKAENKNENSIKNLLLLPTLIEDRINSLNLSIEKEFIYGNKILVNNIYQLYLVENKKYKEIINVAKNIIVNNHDIKETKVKLKQYADSREELRERALVMSILKILKSNESNQWIDMAVVA